MSELDGMSPMNKDQFLNKWIDSHTELKLGSAMYGANSVKKSPGDKNAAHVGKLKKPYEAMGFEKRRTNMIDCLGDAFGIRCKEILNKEDFSIKDLINSITKLLPQQQESKVETTHNFAEEIKRLTIEQKKYKAIDAE